MKVKNENGNWIKIMDCSFKDNGFKLSPLELFVYAFLNRSRLQFAKSWVTYTNIEMLLAALKCKVDGKRKSNKYDTLSDVIISLHNKGYILCDVLSLGNINKIKKNQQLEIRFPLADSPGFKPFDYVKFDQISDRESFYIYCYVATGDEWGKKVSYKELATLTGVAKSTVISRIEDMNKVDAFLRIYKFSGSYISGSVMQDENKYYIKPQNEIIQKWNRFYDDTGKAKINRSKKYSNDDIIWNPFFKDISVKFVKEQIYEHSHWFQKDEESIYDEYKEIVEDDFSIFLTCKRFGIYPNFVKRATDILRAKRSRDDYDGKYEEWEQEFNEEMEEYELKLLEEVNL